MTERFLAWLLGPRCAYGCGQRVFVNDVAWHNDLDHAGDPTPGERT